MTKIRDYAIIDHIGSLEDEYTVKKAYRLAYGLIPEGRKAYTIKQVCQAYNPRVQNLKSMKNAMRMQRHPEQVVLITSDMYSAEWAIRQWIEKVNDITVIHFENAKSFEILTLEDLDPTLTQQWEATPTRKRRCAQIWADALGYTFSAPIYPSEYEISVDMHCKRKAQKYYTDLEVISRKDNTVVAEAKRLPVSEFKATTRPEKYRRYKAVASDAEINEFFQFYKFVYANNCIEDFLVEDYSLCPHCGRPVYNKTEDDRCTYCDTPNPDNIGEMVRYFDTEEIDTSIF